MKVTLERLPESRVLLDIEVDQERLEKSLQVAYRKVAGKARIPGFRPGKAPRHVVERMIGREGLIREALDALVPDVYNDAIKEHDIDAIDQPDLEITEIEPVRFKATVAVRPTIDLGAYTEIRVEQPEVAFDEEEVDRQILRLQRGRATYVPVERGAGWNDQLIAGVIGKIAPDALKTDEDDEADDSSEGDDAPAAETEAEAEATTAEADADTEVAIADAEPLELITFIEDDAAEFSLRDGEELLVPGLAEAFLDMKAGDSKELELEVPEDHRVTQLAGKKSFFTITVSEVKEEQLPELDDEFADSVNPQFKSYDELRADIARQLRERASQEAEIDFRNKAIDALLESATIEYPKVMVDREIDNVIRDSTGNDAQSYRAYLERVGRSEDEFRETFREAADIRVRRGLVLGKLADVENIEATVDDIQGELEKMFAELAEDDGRFRQLFDTEVGRETVRRDLVNRRTMERLLEIVSNGTYVAPEPPQAATATTEETADASDSPVETEAQEETE